MEKKLFLSCCSYVREISMKNDFDINCSTIVESTETVSIRDDGESSLLQID